MVTYEDLGDSSPWLTIGKSYVVLAVKFTLKAGVFVLIHSDNYGVPIFINLLGFEVESKLIPPSWDTVNYYGDIYMMPKSWMYEAFLDEVEERVPEAIDLFYLEAKKMNQQEGFSLKFPNEH